MEIGKEDGKNIKLGLKENGNLILVGPERRELASLNNFYKEWDEETKDAAHYNIHLLGSTNVVEKYFQCCDLFVFLSNLEGFTQCSARSYGLPVFP